MVKNDAFIDENEYSSGWRKLKKDKKGDGLNEDVERKFEELKIKMDNLVSSMANTSHKGSTEEKDLTCNTSLSQVFDERISMLTSSIEEIKKDINYIMAELSEYKNVLYNQLAILVEIMEIEKSKEGTGIETQKSFINNIFKKK